MYYVGTPETNYQLALALNNVKTDERINAIDTARKFIGWINGIYMDDHAVRKTVEGANSHYGILDAGGRTYVTNYTKVNYPVYSLSFGADDVVPDTNIPTPMGPEPNSSATGSNPTIVQPSPTTSSTPGSLQEFLDSYHLSIKAETLVEANELLRQKSKDWIYKYIVVEDGKYVLKQTDDSNLSS